MSWMAALLALVVVVRVGVLASRRFSEVAPPRPWPRGEGEAPIFVGGDIPEQLPGEPRRERPGDLVFGGQLALRLLRVALEVALVGWLWLPYLAGRTVMKRPPHLPRAAQVRRYLGLIWTERPTAPGLPLFPRLWLTLGVVSKCVWIGARGSAWMLDELLYGRQLRAVQLKEPLIEISAARSGSTQLARYLEEDPHLVAPSLLQAVFPYLWLWKLVPLTIGRWVTPAQVVHHMESTMPPEFLQRHEGDPFRTDTFDGALYLAHLNFMCPFLGPEVMVEDFSFAGPAPHNRALWEEDFVEILEGIARRVLLFAGPGPEGRERRFFVKGHFLAAAEALERRFPDARFLTMIREPGPRLQSGVNFLRANPVDDVMGSVSWTWLGEALARTEIAYCDQEMEWFSRQGGARRCVVRFSSYVKDLEGAMAQVYRECLDQDTLPPHVPRQHPPRERTNYLLNRSLAQVGIDEAALNQRLASYIQWCRGGR